MENWCSMVSMPLTSAIYQLMSHVQLPGSKLFHSPVIMNYSTQNNNVSLAKYLQKHIYKEHWKHGVIDQVKYIKRSSRRKWTDREYHV